MAIELDADERRDLRWKARAAVLSALEALEGEIERATLLARALADGGFTPRELSAPVPEAAAGKYTRLIDHQLSWALTDLRRDGLVENPRRRIWKLAGAALETSPPAVEDVVAEDRLAELCSMPYHEYLRTPEWRQTRAAALLRAGHCCSLDVTHTRELEVHHRTYERLGQELASDLVVLCHDCHRLHHSRHGRPRRTKQAPAHEMVSVPPPAAPTPGLNQRRSLLHRLLAR